LSDDDAARSEAVRRLHAALSSLVVGFAHEVYNPLFALSATVDALEQRLLPGDTDEHIRLIRAQIDLIVTLTRDLLAYGSSPRLETALVPLISVLRDAVERCRERADDAHVHVALAAEPLLEIRADVTRLTRAVADLVDNAIRFSPLGGRVAVSGTRRAVDGVEYVDIEIHDDAPGFREPEIAALFEPFRSTRHGSTGLSLALARKIVVAHGGTIQAMTSATGGALVRVRLPTTQAGGT